jgi:hypothetical protein
MRGGFFMRLGLVNLQQCLTKKGFIKFVKLA